jgi:uncharacterized membrane protein
MLSLAASFLLALAGVAVFEPSPGSHDVTTAGLTALALLFNAWWFKRQRALAPDVLHPTASAIAAAAFILGLGWLERIAPAHTATWLALGALGFTVVPFAEFAIIAQALLPFGVAKWAGPILSDGTAQLTGAAMPLDSTIILTCAIALAHWWPRARRFDPALRNVAEAVAAFCSATVAVLWQRQSFHGSQAMMAASVLGIGWVLAARFTRAPFLSLAGLVFSMVAVGDFAQFQATSHWAVALLPIANVAAVGWIYRRHEPARLWLPVAALMFLGWSWAHIHEEWRALFFAAAAAAAALVGAHRREPALSRTALALGALATILFWSRILPDSGMPDALRDISALLVFAAACRVSRRLWPADPMLAAAPFIAWNTVLGITAWMTLHYTLPSLTLAWSLLALAFFAAGLVLRDRHYRLGGLALLGLAVARVFCVDVWAITALWRTVSFIVLGVVLLAVGYAYNRFEEKLRRWF